MATLGVGRLELLLAIVLGLGGLPSLPLSLPPLPPDPIIERAAPDDCLLHVALAGRAKPVAGSANHAEALLAEAEVQRFVGDVAGAMEKMFAREAKVPLVFTADMRSLAFTLLTRPAALTVDSVSIDGPDAPVVGSLVVNCGADADRVRRVLEKVIADLRAIEMWLQVGEFEHDDQKWSRFEGLPPGAPDVAWGFRDGLFLAAVGPEGLQNLLARLANEGRRPPAWKQALEKRLPLARRSLLAHVDAAKCLEIAKLAISDRHFAPAVEAAGLGGLRAVQAVAGLTETEIASATILDFEGAPGGWFAAGNGAVTAADLQAIPADATMAQVLKLDPAATLAAGLAWMEAVQAGSSGHVTQMLERVPAAAGIDLVADLLEPLGDTWTLCVLPGPAPLGLPPTAASVSLDDPQAVAKSLAALTALLAKGAAQPGMPPLRFDRRPAGERTITSARLADSPFAPAWCIDGDRLLIGDSVATIEALIAKPAAPRSLADVPAVAARLGGRPALLGYQEPEAALDLVRRLEADVREVVAVDTEAAGVVLPRLPAAEVVAGHLLPAVSVVRRDAGGDVVAEGRATLPLGPLGNASPAASPTTVSLALPLALPGLQSVLAAHRWTGRMENLPRIYAAIEDQREHWRGFPAAAICDADGKPLLSWRVALLPYLGAKDLYDQFHLDEPWDSEHNKKLVARMPEVFSSPGEGGARPGTTRFLVPTGEGTLFPAADARLQWADVPDGLSKTILMVEVEPARAVPWTQPEDFKVDPKRPQAGLAAPGADFAVMFADGNVLRLPQDVDPETLAALFTPAGHESLGPP